jgi:hypothetical protein
MGPKLDTLRDTGGFVTAVSTRELYGLPIWAAPDGALIHLSSCLFNLFNCQSTLKVIHAKNTVWAVYHAQDAAAGQQYTKNTPLLTKQ